MKEPHEYGVYPWWPEEGLDQFHPDDVERAAGLLPSDRIFRREGSEGEYVVLHYGQERLRIKPGLFKTVRGEGFDLGDHVEVLSRGGKNEHCVGTVREMRWCAATRQIHYHLDHAGRHLPTLFTAEDLRHIEHDLPH